MPSLEAQFRLANAWRMKGRLDHAAAGYRDVLRADPGHLPAAVKLGDLLAVGEDLDEAETIFRGALEHHPNEASLHKRFIDVLIRRRGWEAACEHHGIERQDARPIVPRPHEVLGCAVVRNERIRLPFWLTYYREKGVTRFFVVDNDSTDGTLPYLLEQPDVHVWRSPQSYYRANYGTVWIELLLRRWGVGHWCVITDADELLYYPDCDGTSLPELCRQLDGKGKRAFKALLLDMYAAAPIRDTHYAPGRDFREICRYFDRRFSHRRCERLTLEGRQTIDVGGMRERVFGGSGDYYLSKVPLLRYDADCVLSPHWTNLAAAAVAVESGCLLHFKYFSSFATSVAREVERKEHFGHLFQYEAYADAVARNESLSLFDEAHSVEFRGAEQLLALGVMQDDGTRVSPFVQFRMANIWRAKGKLARAVAGYQAILQRHPDFLPAQLELREIFPQNRVADAEARRPDARSREQLHWARLARGEAGQVLVYTDRADAYGAEQIGHMLMLHLAAHGYAVTCAQPPADHRLVDERERAGIRHHWLSGEEPATTFATTEPDLIVFNDGSPLSSLAAKEAAARRGTPYVIVNHCVTAEWAEGHAAHLRRLPAVYRKAAAVVAVSRENLALLRDRFGLPADRGEVIVNGRPAAYFTPRDAAARREIREALRIPDDAVAVFTAGRLELVKGYQYQLAAMKQLQRRDVWPRLYFLWAGKGTLEGQLRAVVAESGMDAQVRFLGERADVPRLLDAADVFLLPSQFEGMPLALMEAMAKGVATVATAVSGIPEAMGDAGRLLPDPRIDEAATVGALVATLEEWARDPDLRERYGRAGRRRAEAAFDGDRMLTAYLELVRRVGVPER